MYHKQLLSIRAEGFTISKNKQKTIFEGGNKNGIFRKHE